MDSNWRPENWQDRHPFGSKVHGGEFVRQHLQRYEDFEAGASAILEDLKKGGKHIIADNVQLNDQYGFSLMFIHGRGWLVWIPEEE